MEPLHRWIYLQRSGWVDTAELAEYGLYCPAPAPDFQSSSATATGLTSKAAAPVPPVSLRTPSNSAGKKEDEESALAIQAEKEMEALALRIQECLVQERYVQAVQEQLLEHGGGAPTYEYDALNAMRKELADEQTALEQRVCSLLPEAQMTLCEFCKSVAADLQVLQ